jgi:hypothetical protein
VGQWSPQPAPDPVTRTQAPNKTTPKMYNSVSAAKLLNARADAGNCAAGSARAAPTTGKSGGVNSGGMLTTKATPRAVRQQAA